MGFGETISSLFGGPGGAANTDRSLELQGLGDLSKLFQFGFGQGQLRQKVGQGTEQTALSELGPTANYYRQLLSGGRVGVLSATAPTVNATNAMADAQRRQLATNGTARGGGVNAVGQQIETNKNATVDNAIAGARTGAAPGSIAVAGETARIGSSQLDNAMRLLGLSESSATSLADIANRSRDTSMNIEQNQMSKIGDTIGSLLKNPKIAALLGLGA